MNHHSPRPPLRSFFFNFNVNPKNIQLPYLEETDRATASVFFLNENKITKVAFNAMNIKND